ncbi:hypothetical protein [Solidesulfovibrio sp.]
MGNAATVSIGLAKNTFQLHGVDASIFLMELHRDALNGKWALR